MDDSIVITEDAWETKEWDYALSQDPEWWNEKNKVILFVLSLVSNL